MSGFEQPQHSPRSGRPSLSFARVDFESLLVVVAGAASGHGRAAAAELPAGKLNVTFAIERHRLLGLRFLKADERALILAYYAEGKSTTELAKKYQMTPREMWWRLRRLCHRLGDANFVRAMRFGDEVHEPYRGLIRAYWLEGRHLRELAQLRGVTRYCPPPDFSRAMPCQWL